MVYRVSMGFSSDFWREETVLPEFTARLINGSGMYDGKHDRGRALWAGICRLGYVAYTAAGIGEFDELLMTGSRTIFQIITV